MATAIQTTNQEDRIDVFMRKPETLEKFTPILGKSANSFISSALILINSDQKLQACTTMSLYKSVLRAASLELSLDTSLRQGFIVPRPKKIKSYKKDNGEVVPEHYIQEANFQPHYNGVRNLAERTGRYKVINVSPIYEGQHIRLDQLTGLHYILLGNTFTMPEQSNRLTVDNTLDVTGGKPTSQVIGYLGYYKTFQGIERTVYMTIQEIHEHAKKWAKENYASEYGSWKDPKKLPYMEMKTVFLQLTKTMDLSGKESAKLRKAIEIDEGDDFADLEPETNKPAGILEGNVTETEAQPIAMNINQARNVTVNISGETKPLGMLMVDELNSVYLNENSIDATKEAVRLVLSQDFNLDVPETPKRTIEQINKQMGF